MAEKVVKPEDIKIPVECFLYPNGNQQIQAEGGDYYEIEKLDFRDSFEMHIKGGEFPFEGYVTNEMLWQTNQAKSVFIEAIKLLSKPQFMLGTIITFLFFRKHLYEPFNRLGHRIMSPIMFKDKHISPFARELQLMIFEFARHLIPENHADKVSEILSRMIDNDDAYKQRLKDIFSMTTKSKLKKPKELSRLVKIMDKRQGHAEWMNKVKAVVLLLRVAIFIVPNAKKGYISAVNQCNLDNLILHWKDLYWSVYKTDYNFAGMTIEERKEFANKQGWKYPNKMV